MGKKNLKNKYKNKTNINDENIEQNDTTQLNDEINELNIIIQKVYY